MTDGDLNRRLESAARFLNMHARNGIDPENIEFVIVVHGPAGKDLMVSDGEKKDPQKRVFQVVDSYRLSPV